MKKMKKKSFKGKIISRLLYLSLCVVLIIGCNVPVFATGENNLSEHHIGEHNQIIVNNTHQYINTDYYKISKENALGISGGFHMVGFNEVTNNTHVNGNMLAKKLSYRSNFGTNNLDEVSYIQDLSNNQSVGICGNNSNPLLVVGDTVDVGKADNGNAWSLNGHKVNNLDPKKHYEDTTLGRVSNLWQDASKKDFIDIDAVKDEIVELNNKLAEEINSENVVADFSDQNNQNISITAGESGYFAYNLDLQNYKQDCKLNVITNVDGLVKNSATVDNSSDIEYSTLMINVDLEGKKVLNIHGIDLHYINNVSASNGEVSIWENGNVLLNVYDSSEKDNQYDGSINITEKFAGHIIAPNATVNIRSNLNGTVIAEDIHINAETHRSDFTGPLMQMSGARYVDPKTVNVETEDTGTEDAKTTTGDETSNPKTSDEGDERKDQTTSNEGDDSSLSDEGGDFDSSDEDENPSSEEGISTYGLDEPEVEDGSTGDSADTTEGEPVPNDEDEYSGSEEKISLFSLGETEVEDGESKTGDVEETVAPSGEIGTTAPTGEEITPDNNGQPQTSDTTSVLIPLMLMQLSALVAVILVIRKKLYENN